MEPILIVLALGSRMGYTRMNMATAEMKAIEKAKQQNLCNLYLNQIRNSDLDAFEDFLKSDGTLTQPSLILRCKISHYKYQTSIVINKKISEKRYTDYFLPFLQRITPHIQGQVDFFILLSDTLYVSEEKKADCKVFFKKIPFLRCDRSAKDELSQYTILIPDFFIIDSLYEKELKEIDQAYEENPFEDRLEIIKWRGCLTGPESPNIKNRHLFPRLTLLMLSLEYSEFIDARLINFDDFTDDEFGHALKKEIESKFERPAAKVPASTFVKYKYLISIDGVTSAWKRVPTILASGSTLLLQHQWEQFFYAGLRPWFHYVPLNTDLSDLIEKYEWLKKNPIKSKEIAENGRNFAKQILTPSYLEEYFISIINQIATFSFR